MTENLRAGNFQQTRLRKRTLFIVQCNPLTSTPIAEAFSVDTSVSDYKCPRNGKLCRNQRHYAILPTDLTQIGATSMLSVSQSLERVLCPGCYLQFRHTIGLNKVPSISGVQEAFQKWLSFCCFQRLHLSGFSGYILGVFSMLCSNVIQRQLYTLKLAAAHTNLIFYRPFLLYSMAPMKSTRAATEF